MYTLLYLLFIYVFLAELGLHCYTVAFFSCGEQGLLSIQWCVGFSLELSFLVQRRL